MRRFLTAWAVVAVSFAADTAAADTTTLTMHEVTAEGIGAPIGEIHFTDTDHGLLIAPDLRGAMPGLRGTHIHQNPNCGPAEVDGVMAAARGAGGHFDPGETGKHLGPFGDGHLGDLPNVVVEADGSAVMPVLAPHVTVADLAGRALVIHAGLDRYDGDQMGGGRLYCGVFE